MKHVNNAGYSGWNDELTSVTVNKGCFLALYEDGNLRDYMDTMAGFIFEQRNMQLIINSLLHNTNREL